MIIINGPSTFCIRLFIVVLQASVSPGLQGNLNSRLYSLALKLEISMQTLDKEYNRILDIEFLEYEICSPANPGRSLQNKVA